MAQAAACESNSKMFYIRPSEVLSKYQGESERHLARLFQEARAAERAVIFFDGVLKNYSRYSR
jgi:transitional endoplasmic reticulum ATPase